MCSPLSSLLTSNRATYKFCQSFKLSLCPRASVRFALSFLCHTRMPVVVDDINYTNSWKVAMMRIQYVGISYEATQFVEAL